MCVVCGIFNLWFYVLVRVIAEIRERAAGRRRGVESRRRSLPTALRWARGGGLVA